MVSIYLTSEDALRYVRVLTEMLQIMTSSPEDFQVLQSRRICSDELIDESITTLTAINRLLANTVLH